MEAKELRIGLGVTLQITTEEETAIFSCSDRQMADAIKKKHHCGPLSIGRRHLRP